MGDAEESVRGFNTTKAMFMPSISRKEEERARVDGRRYLDGARYTLVRIMWVPEAGMTDSENVCPSLEIEKKIIIFHTSSARTKQRILL